MASTSSITGRIFGVFGLLFQIGMLFAYGFASQLYNEGSTVGLSLTAANSFLVEFILMLVFALLGFGLLLSFLKYGTWSGMATALMVVSVNIQLGLLMQKFWFNVFLYDFGSNVNISNTILANNAASLASQFARADFIARQQFVNIMPNVLTYRIALMATISCLVAFLGFIGRIGLFETFFTTISFTVGWNLNYYLNVNLQINRAPIKILFDDFGTDNIYLFGSSFALFMMILLNCKPARIADNSSYVMNRISGLLGLIGTAFVFATFALTGHIFSDRQNDLSTNILSLNLESLNIIYALSASVVGSYIFSALFNKGHVGIREAMLGTITGGVLIGCVSAFLYNLVIAISVGLFAGLISAFWLSFLHPKLFNSTNVFDSHGVLGAFWITSFFGGVVFAPSLIQVYSNYGFGQNYYGTTLFGTPEYNFVESAAGWQLVYAGISAGIGMAFGLGTGIIMVIMRNYEDDFNDAALFIRGDYGLYVQQKDENIVQESAANLNNGQ